MNGRSLFDTIVEDLVLLRTRWEYSVEGETILLWAGAGGR